MAARLRAALADRALGGVLSKQSERSVGEIIREARESWARLGPVPGPEGVALETRFEDALYHAAPESVWDAFAASDAESVVIVGHNPGIGELVSMLVHQAHDGSKLAREFSGHFPTAAFAAFEIRGELMRAAGPSLVAAWKPRDKDD